MNRRWLQGLGLLVALTLTGAGPAWGWWSVPLSGSSTHHRLAEAGVALAPDAATPPNDLDRFGGDLADWTSDSGDDANAHGTHWGPLTT